MSINCGPPREISDADLECLSYFASEGAREAWIFVHGFKGEHDPRQGRFRRRLPGAFRGGGTWCGFEDVVTVEEAFCERDVYFIGYPSVMSDTHVNAARLLAFIEKQLAVDGVRKSFAQQDPVKDAGDGAAVAAKDPEPYESVVFVAHSEGGVVVRKAVALAAREYEAHKGNTLLGCVATAHLFLFAPAQGGHRVGGAMDAATDIAGGLTLGVGKLLNPAVYSRAYQDMSPGSLGLSRLQAQSKSVTDRKVRTLWSDNDAVVEAVDYSGDLPSRILVNSSHLSVCKPVNSGTRQTILSFLSKDDALARTPGGFVS